MYNVRNTKPKYSSPSTTSRASFGKHFNNVLAKRVWALVSQIIRTCKRDSPRAPLCLICQHAA